MTVADQVKNSDINSNENNNEENNINVSEKKQSTIYSNELDKYKKNNNIPIDYLRFFLGAVIVCCLLYYMYNVFYENQLEEPFIEKTIKSDVISDEPSNFDNFNVIDEICILKRKQEEYLNKLNN